MTVLAFVSDLMFRSKIDVAVRACGAQVRYARTGEAAAAAFTAAAPDLVIVDLGVKAADPVRAIAAIRACSAARIIAFGAHVDAESLAAARASGADPVLPRSAFARTLPELLGAVAR